MGNGPVGWNGLSERTSLLTAVNISQAWPELGTCDFSFYFFDEKCHFYHCLLTNRAAWQAFILTYSQIKIALSLNETTVFGCLFYSQTSFCSFRTQWVCKFNKNQISKLIIKILIWGHFIIFCNLTGVGYFNRPGPEVGYFCHLKSFIKLNWRTANHKRPALGATFWAT